MSERSKKEREMWSLPINTRAPRKHYRLQSRTRHRSTQVVYNENGFLTRTYIYIYNETFSQILYQKRYFFIFKKNETITISEPIY